VAPRPCVIVAMADEVEAENVTEAVPNEIFLVVPVEASWSTIPVARDGFGRVPLSAPPSVPTLLAAAPFLMFWEPTGNWAAREVRFLPVSSSVPGG